MRFILGGLMTTILAAGSLAAAAPVEPAQVRVRLETSAGSIVIAVDTRHAPKTAANFLAYVDDQRLDGTAFFRASRRPGKPGLGFIEGGIGTDARRRLGTLPLEPTSTTGLRHVDGVISMARYDALDSGTANFSLMSGPFPNMDARPGSPGYAVFGRVVGGMAVVKRILAMPTSQGRRRSDEGRNAPPPGIDHPRRPPRRDAASDRPDQGMAAVAAEVRGAVPVASAPLKAWACDASVTCGIENSFSRRSCLCPPISCKNPSGLGEASGDIAYGRPSEPDRLSSIHNFWQKYSREP